MGKRMRLRRDDVCASCGTELLAGTTADWFADERLTRCVECSVPARPAGHVGTAGASALAEYERRAERERGRQERAVEDDAAWRARVRAEHRFFGPLVTALTRRPVVAESRTTAVWRVGAEGEQRVAEVLRDVPGIEVLHDRRWPGSRGANIDHVVVGPAGVFVIDAKKYQGKIELVDRGSWLRSDWRLHVAGRNRTELVDSVSAQAEAVRGVLNPFATVPVSSVLCFIGADWGVLGPRKVKQLRGVTLLWPLKLPEWVSAPGGVDVAAVAAHLRSVLAPATVRRTGRG